MVASLVTAAILPGAARARAQNVMDSVRTANGYCHIWQPPPGFSNPPDYSYSRCAVDRPARRLSGPDMPAPTLGTYAGGSLFIAVRPDGTVDSALTRRSTITGDTSFDNHVLETVRQWRYEPALRNGVAVRSGWYLEIRSDSRNDTLPSRLVWRYVQGPTQDTAIGRWVVDTVHPPPVTPTEADSVYAAVFRELIREQVLLRDPGQRYCVLSTPGDAATAQRAATVARGAVRGSGPQFTTSAGCERDPAFVRLRMPSVFRSEGDRVVLFPSGDFLPVWPWGLDAKSWRAWTGRCVGRLLAGGTAAVACGIDPIRSMAERLVPLAPQESKGPAWTDGDSVRFRIFVTRAGAFLVDTLRFTVGPLSRVETHAVLDSLLPCGGWNTHSTQPESVYVVHGGIAGSSLQITLVDRRSRPPQGRPATCSRQASADTPFAAFFLGGLGARATAPVRLCFSNCAFAYDLDPARHTLAAAPAAVIRVSELRHETQLGGADVMRILIDHGPPDAAVLVAYQTGGRLGSYGLIPRHTAEGRWDFAANLDDDPARNVFLVYLFRR